MPRAAAAGHRDRPAAIVGSPLLPPSRVTLLLILMLSLLPTTLLSVSAGPIPDLTREYRNLVMSSDSSTTDNSADNSTDVTTNTDVYVIKAVVYEIGILTDTDNTTTDENTERHERVDISLFDPPRANDEFS
ncbi:PREDICTED: uncharacterized protein LOC106750362 [Dinoponera quadriceps]|uniref:Uncharacterized protein LOC106750362 n=1 Tax=Dinoponera quadriceps TaxID=609295 RepID=A0A6P3Y5F2_DINQU|nr:PREDICTED: uncharacterized protein LOC106750362 [Dinoponera quadriceps]